MASAPLIHARCAYSPRFSSCNRSNYCTPSSTTPSSSSYSSSSSSSSFSSSSCSSSSSSFNHGHGLSFSSGTSNSWRHQGRKAQAMGTTTQRGNIESTKRIANGKNEPDHLLVLVHGIMARYMLDKDYAQNSTHLG